MTALVTGASRGFGRAIAAEFARAGADVVAVARDPERLQRLRNDLGEAVTVVPADAADPAVAASLLERYRPSVLVLNAGAAPELRAIQDHTWETFSVNWDVDVRQAFEWTRQALRLPLGPGSTVVAMSSGAALMGSPLSGGYAGAKAAVRFVAEYAAEESDRLGLGIRFFALLPKLTPATELGAAAVAAYAKLRGVDAQTYVARQGPALSAEDVARAVAELVGSNKRAPGAYLVTPAGLSALD